MSFRAHLTPSSLTLSGAGQHAAGGLGIGGSRHWPRLGGFAGLPLGGMQSLVLRVMYRARPCVPQYSEWMRVRGLGSIRLQRCQQRRLWRWLRVRARSCRNTVHTSTHTQPPSTAKARAPAAPFSTPPSSVGSFNASWRQARTISSIGRSLPSAPVCPGCSGSSASKR